MCIFYEDLCDLHIIIAIDKFTLGYYFGQLLIVKGIEKQTLNLRLGGETMVENIDVEVDVLSLTYIFYVAYLSCEWLDLMD